MENVTETYVTIKNSPFFSRTVFMCFVYINLTIAIISLNNINHLAFFIGQSVFLPVRTELLNRLTQFISGWDSSVGRAIPYGLDGPRIDSRWGEMFLTCPDRPRGPPSLLYKAYRVFPRE